MQQVLIVMGPYSQYLSRSCFRWGGYWSAYLHRGIRALAAIIRQCGNSHLVKKIKYVFALGLLFIDEEVVLKALACTLRKHWQLNLA